MADDIVLLQNFVMKCAILRNLVYTYVVNNYKIPSAENPRTVSLDHRVLPSSVGRRYCTDGQN